MTPEQEDDAAMDPVTIYYTAPPGQLKFGRDLTNTEKCKLKIEGYPIPAHTDGDGWLLRPGFDILKISLAKETEIASATALVYAPAGQELHWTQCRQAVQWADDKAMELT